MLDSEYKFLNQIYTFLNLNYRPAEWRWKMPHVCDDEWHHYALNVDFPQVIMHKLFTVF